MSQMKNYDNAPTPPPSNACLLLVVKVLVCPLDDLERMPSREMLYDNNGAVIQEFANIVIDLQRHGMSAVGFQYRVGHPTPPIQSTEL